MPYKLCTAYIRVDFHSNLTFRLQPCILLSYLPHFIFILFPGVVRLRRRHHWLRDEQTHIIIILLLCSLIAYIDSWAYEFNRWLYVPIDQVFAKILCDPMCRMETIDWGNWGDKNISNAKQNDQNVKASIKKKKLLSSYIKIFCNI